MTKLIGKKLLYFFIAIGIAGISYFYLSKQTSTAFVGECCAFCNMDVLNRQKFYEDDFVVALYTHKPILPGHCLIVSKRHVERFEMLTDQEITQIGRVIKKVDQAASKVFNTSSYLILQKNGVEAGQSVPHVHFHYIPRPKGDDSTLKFLMKMYRANWKKPISEEEMKKNVAEMKEAMAYLEKGPDFFISKGQRLLEWNKEKLTSHSNLQIEDLKEIFAPEFIVIANDRKYDANHQSYYEFLNKFRSNIEDIDYQVQEYLSTQSTVMIPLKASVKHLQGKEDIFDAILFIKFNDSGKIVHWQEVYSIR